jgi:hypothetical protein
VLLQLLPTLSHSPPSESFLLISLLSRPITALFVSTLANWLEDEMLLSLVRSFLFVLICKVLGYNFIRICNHILGLYGDKIDGCRIGLDCGLY